MRLVRTALLVTCNCTLVARTLLCTCGCVLHWYSNRQGRWLMVDVLVTGLKSDWSGSGKQRLVPVQNQYQDRYIL